jgi:hypothetical protein
LGKLKADKPRINDTQQISKTLIYALKKAFWDYAKIYIFILLVNLEKPEKGQKGPQTAGSPPQNAS